MAWLIPQWFERSKTRRIQMRTSGEELCGWISGGRTKYGWRSFCLMSVPRRGYALWSSCSITRRRGWLLLQMSVNLSPQSPDIWPMWQRRGSECIQQSKLVFTKTFLANATDSRNGRVTLLLGVPTSHLAESVPLDCSHHDVCLYENKYKYVHELLPSQLSKAYRIPHSETCYHITVLRTEGHIQQQRRCDNSPMTAKSTALIYTITWKEPAGNNSEAAAPWSLSWGTASVAYASRTWRVYSVNYQYTVLRFQKLERVGIGNKIGTRNGPAHCHTQWLSHRVSAFCFVNLELCWGGSPSSQGVEKAARGYIKCSTELEAATVTLLIWASHVSG